MCPGQTGQTGQIGGNGRVTCDVAIIGGGLVGASLAYELVTRGADVVLVDRHHQGRATDAGAGILSPETYFDEDDGWAALARSAGEHHRQLDQRVTEDGAEGGTGRSVCGLIKISASEGEDDWFNHGLQLARRRTPEIVTVIDPSEAARAFPPLGPVRLAMFNPIAARIDGRKATAAIMTAALLRGLRTMSAEVTDFEIDRVGVGDADGAGDADGERVTAIVSDAGRVFAGSVAIAGGAWTSRFADQLHTTIPVKPLKGQIIHLTLPGVDTGTWPILQPVMSHYLVPWPDSRVACGGTLEADAGFDTRVTAHGVHELLREGLKTAPGLGTATIKEVRVGLRPASADDRPVLGKLPDWSNVYVATGHGTEGLLIGPYTAMLVAESILSGQTPEEISGLTASRFS